MKKTIFDEVQKSKKLKIIQNNVESKKKIRSLIKSERKMKINFLKKLSGIYQYLLYPLFNLE